MNVYDLTDQRRRSLERVDAAICNLQMVLEGLQSASSAARDLVVTALLRLEVTRSRLMLGLDGAAFPHDDPAPDYKRDVEA